MTAQPIDHTYDSQDPYAHLPRVSILQAQRHGLSTVRETAKDYGSAPATIRTWLERVGIQPVAILDTYSYGHPQPLYTPDQISRAVSGAQRRGSARIQRVRSAPPRLIGTRTPSAGRPYVWRDPVRWNRA
jgi:hypothetical protein